MTSQDSFLDETALKSNFSYPCSFSRPCTMDTQRKQGSDGEIFVSADGTELIIKIKID